MEAASCPSCSAPLSGNRCAGCGAAARAGAFRVLSVLAQSPHGRTYRAQGPTGMVALKELVFALVPTAQQLEAFEREARLLGSRLAPTDPAPDRLLSRRRRSIPAPLSRAGAGRR